MDDLCIRPVSPIGRRSTFAHVNHIDPAKRGFQWIEVDVYPSNAKGKNLRDFRIALGYGLREAARMLGVSVTQVSDLERGRATCDWRVAKEMLAGVVVIDVSDTDRKGGSR